MVSPEEFPSHSLNSSLIRAGVRRRPASSFSRTPRFLFSMEVNPERALFSSVTVESSRRSHRARDPAEILLFRKTCRF
jgi:hypothetical protein